MRNISHTSKTSQDGLKLAGKGLHQTVKDKDGNETSNSKYVAFHAKENELKIAYQEYDDHTNPCELEAITAMPLTISEKQGLRDLYDRKRPFLKALWEEVAYDGGEYIMCPLCGQKVVEDLDHYIPRARMPEYSVHLLNLIPTCHECNDDKDEHWLNENGERMFFNAYFDRLENMSQLLKSEIFIDADTGQPRVKVAFDDGAVAASGEIGRLVTSTYNHIESIRKQWRVKATVTLKNQLRQIKSSLSVRIRNGKYVDGDWSHEKETLVETLADLEPHEFIEKVVYENMLASVELDAWIVEKARNL